MHVLVVRPLVWFVRWLGVRTFLSLLLLLLAVSTVSLGLAEVVRGLDITLLLPIAVSGLVLGWAVARSSPPGWLAAAICVVLGAAAVLAWVGMRWPLESSPSSQLALTDLADLIVKTNALLLRVRGWALALSRAEAGFDPVVATLLWGLLLWLAAVWAGWAVRRRHQPLQGIMPLGALLAVILSYTWADAYLLLGVLVGAALLLMAVTGQVSRERRWQTDGIDFSPELRLDLALVAISLTLPLVLVAILVPSVAVRPLVRVAERLLAEHLSSGRILADSMGLEPLAASGIAFGRVRAPGLPNQSLIGSGPELSDQAVMIIYVEGLERTDQTGTGTPVVNQPYWRALTYDEYTGRGWRTRETETVAYRAGEIVDLDESVLKTAAHRLLRQEVHVVDHLGGVLYRAGELLTADRDFLVAWRSRRDIFGAQIEHDVYRADTVVPVVAEAQLRSAGNSYPDWVRDDYLTLPPGLPARVLSLARDLTANQSTPFDRARAIEAYLRAFPYTLDVPAPPPNREVADYFLFELKRGYCDYYATAMVVLARATGLPARLVTGYVSGSYDAEKARYVVTAADAHSWVEIFFPGYGWLEFEPTGGRPPIDRTAERGVSEVPELQAPLEPAGSWPIKPHQALWLGLVGPPLVLGLGALAWWGVDNWRLRRLPPAAAVVVVYQRLYSHARRLGVPVETGDTPYEFEAELTECVRMLAHGRRFVVATTINREIRWLTAMYVRGLFSSRKPVAADVSQALTTWRRLRRRLWLASFAQRTRRKNGLKG